MTKEQQAIQTLKEIIKLIFPEKAQNYEVKSKVDEKGILLDIYPTEESIGLLIGKQGRNVIFLRKVMRKWALFNQCFVSLRVFVNKTNEKSLSPNQNVQTS
ncbi:MAG: hypothetical protein KatS3mg096_733 [Candidatus Parcubacteria bacterium]|nr:MAG: hypothetical protein KatS3mg096_733 [Candidatus Parcubacteria bacterium]